MYIYIYIKKINDFTLFYFVYYEMQTPLYNINELIINLLI